eukprot:761931-Hanusia_phi.AAC.2
MPSWHPGAARPAGPTAEVRLVRSGPGRPAGPGRRRRAPVRCSEPSRVGIVCQTESENDPMRRSVSDRTVR